MLCKEIGAADQTVAVASLISHVCWSDFFNRVPVLSFFPSLPFLTLPFLASPNRHRPSSSPSPPPLFHSDSRTENEYCLQHEYGFPVKDIPLTNTHHVKVTDRWRTWFKLRQEVDKAHHQQAGPQAGQQQQPLHVGPVPFDCPDLRTVVFKNGGAMWDHPPNKVLRSVFATKEGDRHSSTSNSQKRRILLEIIDEVRAMEFGFCRWDTQRGWYLPIDDSTKDGLDVLINCVNNAFKYYLRRAKVHRGMLQQPIMEELQRPEGEEWRRLPSSSSASMVPASFPSQPLGKEEKEEGGCNPFLGCRLLKRKADQLH